MTDNQTTLGRIIRFSLQNKLVVFLCVLLAFWGGVAVAPFDWQTHILRSPVPVDAIPDIGENQQIVFTKWPGRSPQDVEDQISYPLTVALLGVPGVKTIRAYSYFGYSSIYVIFKEDVEFYWSRSRILEKLSSLSPGTLPDSVSPVLGPDATALGQVFWYTIEGRDLRGEPAGGWDLDEIRSVQDWHVRYALQGVEGVSEVASVGGFVKEYQVDVDPDALHAYGVTLSEVIGAVKGSNIDVGARTIEVNSVEYVIRGIGYIRELADIENTVVKTAVDGNIPVYIKNLAHVSIGPALRRGALDKDGAEVVGGVVVVRYGENPLVVIKKVKERVEEISPSLPQRKLSDGTISKLTVVPFYDRTGLIYETLGTLNSALREEILVTIIMIVVMLMNLGSSLLVSGLLPLAVLVCFIFMKFFGVDANVVALSGIAIAIGTMVDMGIVLCQNIFARLKQITGSENRLEVIYEASLEVAPAVLTAALTTVVSFLPVFSMEAAEGKLFKPLAFTKTFALLAAVVIALVVIPPAAHLVFKRRSYSKRFNLIVTGLAVFIALYYLAASWMPFGVNRWVFLNFLFTGLLIAGTLYLFRLFESVYPNVLTWCLTHKKLFMLLPVSLILAGVVIWSRMGKEFMPPLDEGSYLYMPTTMPHASIGEALDQLKKLDLAVSQIPEVKMVVGKLGRADTPLDPAPISMFENVINYKSEYLTDEAGSILKFKYDSIQGEFSRDANGSLVPDKSGKPYRQWRSHIRSPDDIWKEITAVAKVPGVTSAPRLQPIAARIVMLQSGMRAPMGIKIMGPSLEALEEAGLQLEKYLRKVPEIVPATVVADRVVGKPYLEIHIDRSEIARYGLSVQMVQEAIEVAIGGKPLTQTVEGRERYAVRIRYPRELRSSIGDLEKIFIPTPRGQQIPLGELAEIKFTRQAQVIKSEDTFYVSYVVFDKKTGIAEVDVVKQAKRFLIEKIENGELIIPTGVSYSFAGTYLNQLRSEKKLATVIPLALLIIFLLLYFQFRSSTVALLVFSGVFVAWSGGFIMLWLYEQDWFFNITILGTNLRELFQMKQYNLSTAVWVGFLALFGIATDDGVLISTYIGQQLKALQPKTVMEAREAVLQAGKRRIKPALMTTATTLLALLPVLTSRGRGSDIMVPMAIPSFGGMLVAVLTVLVVPVLYCAVVERDVMRTKSR